MKKVKVNKNLTLLIDKDKKHIDLIVDGRFTGYNEELNKYFIRLKLTTLKQLKERLGKMSNEIFKNLTR